MPICTSKVARLPNATDNIAANIVNTTTELNGSKDLYRRRMQNIGKLVITAPTKQNLDI